ncbi:MULTISPECIES: hypothetical protein [unclassified Streptomyces]|uniref:hypothetical protein n=1 Tax=unclassified Streptomyces TaxID=2593676 RepID=UPI000AB909FE|nr:MULTISPECIES: hypothetical protein [unclassified Streptomyces]
MYEYEMQQMRTADLIRRADRERRVREAARVRRAAEGSAEHESHSRRFRRHLFARAA